MLFIRKYKVLWILKWQYHLTSPAITTIVQSPRTSSSTAVIWKYTPIEVVTRQYFIKWWDNFKAYRIIEHVQQEFPLQIHVQAPCNSITPAKVNAKEPKNKGKVSGIKFLFKVIYACKSIK